MSAGKPEWVVFCGGTSREREVSIRSGKAVFEELNALGTARLEILDHEQLPAGLDPQRDIAVPMLHGRFGEDGQLQGLLEDEGFSFAGCDSGSSALCMDKLRAKQAAHAVGLYVLPHASGEAGSFGGLEEVLSGYDEWVIKPVDEGSSVGLYLIDGRDALRRKLQDLDPGRWMVEPRLRGHDVTVGVLQGKALGAVEIFPQEGVYDFNHKYQPGSTRYRYPAALPAATTDRLRCWAEAVFEACGCRDFSRVDFFLDSSGKACFLEINTLPGMTATSLLPKSAEVCGYGFRQLIEAMVAPAFLRWQEAQLCSPQK